MIRNSEKCVFVDDKKMKQSPLNAITDAAVSLEPGKILVYQFGRHGSFHNPAKCGPDPVKVAAFSVASRLGLSLVQWPNGPASQSDRTWCYGIQRPSLA